jgi:hypothetical protein
MPEKTDHRSAAPSQPQQKILSNKMTNATLCDTMQHFWSPLVSHPRPATIALLSTFHPLGRRPPYAASRCAAMLARNSTPTVIVRLAGVPCRSTQTTRAGIICRRFASASPDSLRPT